ncbi:hypothetical protein J8J27_28740, partial [Mycobacterium tuberculosis]|nr:hypothetical protein [Mycobacterium tuberculosis]
RRTRLGGLGQLLATLSYRSVLQRGYALVRDAAGRPLRSAAVPAGTALAIEFHDGRLAATAGAPLDDRPPPEPTRPARKARSRETPTSE